MANVSTTVPNLIQGVSQQSPSLRFKGQCEEQTNAVGSVLKGLIKRPYARLIDSVTGATVLNKDFFFFINRGEYIKTAAGAGQGEKTTERYVGVINGTPTDPKLKIYNLDTGAPADITYDGSTSQEVDLPSYFNSPGTAQDYVNYIKSASYADTTYLLNTTVTAAKKTSSKTRAYRKQDGLAFVKIGAQGANYTLNITDDDTNEVTTNAVINLTWRNNGHAPRAGHRNQFYEIDTVTIVNGGAGYTAEDPPTVFFASDPGWRTIPAIKLGVSAGGVVDSAEILERGSLLRRDGVGIPSGTDLVSVSGGQGELKITVDNNANKDEIATTYIANGFKQALSDADPGNHLTDTPDPFDGHNSYTATLRESTILISRDDGKDFTLQASDSLGNTAFSAIKGSVRSLSDLPVVAPMGFQIKVEGSKHLEEDDYYLEFRTNNGADFGAGQWVESAAYNMDDRLDETTLPYTLENTGKDAFTLRPTDWARRTVGDESSNPFPSFVGSKISDLFFFKNRLGFLSEDKVVLSEHSVPSNLFRTTVRTLLDTAPIDVTVSTDRVENLHSAVPFQDNMILFSERGQFIIDGRDLVTPSTIAVNSVTNYSTDTSARPEAIGPFIYFPSQRGGFHSINEFALQDAADIYESTDITAQVPSYIPRNSYFKMTGSTTENILAVTTGNCAVSPTTQKHFLYKFVFQERQKVISAWSELTFPFNVYALEFINSELFVIGMDPGNSNMIICKMDMREEVVDDDTTGDVILHLDSRKNYGSFDGSTDSFDALVREGTSHQGTGTSTLSFYDALGRAVSVQAQAAGTTRSFNTNGVYISGDITPLFDAFIPAIADDDAGNKRYDTGVALTVRAHLKITAANTATLSYITNTKTYTWTSTTPGGDATDPATYTSWSATSNSTGTPEVTTRFKGTLIGGFPYTMSYKFSEPVFKQGSPPVQFGSTRYILRHLTLFFTDAHNFKIKVTPFRRDVKTFTYDADDQDTTNYDSGRFRASVLTSADDTVIELVNDGPFSANFNSAEFEANVHQRHTRI